MANSSDTPHYEHINFALPKNWQLSTLGEVFYMHAGKNIVASEISSNADETYRYKCIGGNGLRGYVQQFNTEGSFPIIGRQGALCGNINYVEGRFYATEHAVVVDTFCKTNVKWAFYFLIKLNLNQYATATAQPGLSVNTICDVQIPLPPLTEQQRIVAEIERWFALIDTVEQGKADLQTAIKQTKSKILDLAIHGKLVPQDPNDEPVSELLKRINPKAQITCDNEHYPKLPKGWSITSMQEVCGLFDGERQEDRLLTSLDAKFLRGFSDGKVIKAGRYVPANTYMILVDGENSGEVFQTSTEGYQGSTFKQLNINENMNEKFVLHIINLHRKSLRENKVGSAIPHLNKKLFKAIPVPIPPYAEQERIINAINAAYALLTVIEENL